ncbi:MAG: hypothetical protein ACR2HI_01105 [Gaiella sp.]
MAFELDLKAPAGWAVDRGLVPAGTPIEVEELTGGDSASDRPARAVAEHRARAQAGARAAIRWPELADDLELLADRFLAAYKASAEKLPAIDEASLSAHTACLILARTDGVSPAQFLDEPSREQARSRGRDLLLDPARGLWA